MIYRKTENLHIFLWLIKDFCWVTDFKILGLFMIVPTVSVAIYLTFKTRELKSELWHNMAIVCWILANSTWMLGEFYFNDQSRPFAIVFFISGLMCLCYYYFVVAPFWITDSTD